MDVSRIVGSLIVIIVVVLLLKYLYAWLNGTADAEDVLIYSPSGNGLVANNSQRVISVSTPGIDGSSPPQIYGGGEFSMSTWVYINNWSYATNFNKVFLTMSSNGGTSTNTLVMYLGQSSNTLSVRIASSGTDGTQLTPTDMNAINTTLGGAGGIYDNSTNLQICDIDSKSIDLQRWVNITTVVSGRTVDVYINGKLTRSCVLPGIYTIESGYNTTVTLGGGGAGAKGFGGYIGQTRMANFAYSPDFVYTNYLKGPVQMSMIGQLLGMLGINVSATMPHVPVPHVAVTWT